MNSGIYKIQSIVHPERFYIGSAKDVHKRKIQHFHHLRKGVHHNRHLQRHVNKYGLDDLTQSLITYCEPSQLLTTEQFYFDTLCPTFNLARIAGKYEGTRKPRNRYTLTDSERSKSAQIRNKPANQVGHFLLLQESLYQTYGHGNRKHVWMCTHCGSISLMTCKKARQGTCRCKDTYSLSKGARHRRGTPAKRRVRKGRSQYNTLYINNTSGYPGVVKHGDQWRARIKHKGKLIAVGYYSTPLQAHEARQARLKSMGVHILPFIHK